MLPRPQRGDVPRVRAELATDAFKLFSTPRYQLLRIPLSETRGTNGAEGSREEFGSELILTRHSPRSRWATLMKAAQ